MKLKSLILGSVAAAGLSTAGFAADLGVLTLRKIAKGNCDVIIRRDDQGNRRSAEGG